MLSIVICTYNRDYLLKLALDSLKKQSNKNFEVLVVDNNSTDNTREVVINFKIEGTKVKYFFEPKIGLSNARNRGVMESKGNYVAYIDDDCILPENWVDLAIKIINNKKSDIFGGPVYPYYLNNKPSWFKDTYQTFDFGDDPISLKGQKTVFGGNMVIKKSIFKILEGFDSKLGMQGEKVLYSEETDFQLRYKKLSKESDIYYDPVFFVYHYVRPEKLSLNWNIKAFIAKGRSNVLIKNSIHKNTISNKLFQIVIQILKLIYFFSIGAIFRRRKKYPFYQNYIMERVQPHLKKYGFLLEQFQK